MNTPDMSLQRPIYLPSGYTITNPGPVVIIGPNGSGKSRRSRTITSDTSIEVISALRNTRIAQQLQPMALQQAKQNFINQRDNAKNQPYELTNDFDSMLTALIGEAAESSLDYLAKVRKGGTPELPPLTNLEEIQQLWGKFFPGRELGFREYLPKVTNTVAVGDEPKTYSAWEMSDGEKAALYLAGRALSAEPSAVLLIDEPETHLHSLLAVQFWDEIELARPDLRLIYITHDMTFAASRRATQYILANPIDGLRPIELASNAGDLAAILLGTASLSFYAKRVIFCEGDSESLDARMYSAWFNDKKDIVQAVGSCEMVCRSVMALTSSDLISNLEVKGIIDRDFRSDIHLSTLPSGVLPLGVHEIETLFSLPDVVEAVASHLKVPFDRQDYEKKVVALYNDDDRHKVILERWKLRVNAALMGVISDVTTKNNSLDNLTNSLPGIFDQTKWSFSPTEILKEEKSKIEALFTTSPPSLVNILSLMPGKQLRALPTNVIGVKLSIYDNLVIEAVKGSHPDLQELTKRLRIALSPFMPFK